MTFQRTASGTGAALLVSLVLAACGGNPNNASGGNTCNRVSIQGSARGMMNATINGATFTGGVPTGLSIYTPIPPSGPPTNTPALDFIIFTGICGDNTSIQITARTLLGSTNFGLGALEPFLPGQPLTNSGLLTLRTGGALAGLWNTNFQGGTGSITLQTVSTAGASGSFSMTMVPQAGTGASGNKQVDGTFNVTF